MGNSFGHGASHSQYNFDYFVNKYGRDTMLSVAKDNVRRQQIQRKMPEIVQKYRNSIHQAKIASVRQLNITEANIIQQIQQKIKQIEKSDTVQVYKAEEKFNKSAEDLLGRQKIIKDCNSLRHKILESYENEERKTKEKIESEFQGYLEVLEKDRKAKFVQIEQLTNENRQAVKKKAQKEFKRQIKSYRKELGKQIEEGRVVGVVQMEFDFSHLHPKEEIKKLKERAAEFISSGQDKIMGKFFSMGSIGSQEILPQAGFWKCC